MALKSAIFKVDLDISNIDHNHYSQHNLTIARHPSETDLRMMLRVVVFACHASDTIQFTKGLCSSDEPDLWQKNMNDDIELWIELGQPDEKRIRKACSRAKNVIVYCYSTKSAAVWWKQAESKFSRYKNLTVRHIPEYQAELLATWVNRSMCIHAVIQDGVLTLTNENHVADIVYEMWK